MKRSCHLGDLSRSTLVTIHDFLHRKRRCAPERSDVDMQLEYYERHGKKYIPCSYYCLCRDDVMWLTYAQTRDFLSPLPTDTFRSILQVVSRSRKNSWLTSWHYDSILTHFVAAMFCDFYNLHQCYPQFAHERHGSRMIDTGLAPRFYTFCLMAKKMKYVEGAIASYADIQTILRLSKLILTTVFRQNDTREAELMLYINKRCWMAPNEYVLHTTANNKVVAYTVHVCTFLHHVFAFGEENLFPPIWGLEIVWRCGASLFYLEKSSSSPSSSSSSVKRLTLLRARRTKTARELLSAAVDPPLLTFIQTLIDDHQKQQRDILAREPNPAENRLLRDALAQLHLSGRAYCGEHEVMKCLQFDNPLLAPPLLSDSYFRLAHAVSRYYMEDEEAAWFLEFNECFVLFLKTLMTYFYAAVLCDSGYLSGKDYHHYSVCYDDEEDCPPMFSGVYDSLDAYVKMEAPSDDEMCKLWVVTSHVLQRINVSSPLQLFGNDEVEMYRACVFSSLEYSRLPYDERLVLTMYVARLCFYLQTLYTFRKEYLKCYHHHHHAGCGGPPAV